MDLPADLREVIAHHLCIGCGACVHADPSLKLVLDPAAQMYQPDGPGNAAAAAVCPAVGVDFDFLQRQRFGDAPRGALGVVRAVMLGQSTNYERNLKASSGGLIKELLLDYLTRGEADGAIALAHVAGLEYAPRLIREAAAVDQLPGSIYHSLPFDGALRLLRDHEGRFVLVAIPCQLEGIFSYVYKCQPELARRIHTTVGLVCGWQYSHHALRAICHFRGIDFDKIEHISYRGDGPVGRLRIKAPQGEYRVNRRIHFDYQVAFDRSFNIPRCHLCINHSNFLADIVVGDAWLPCTVRTKTGISLVICRTPAAVATLRRLEAEGRVVLAEVTEQEVIESQTRQVALGDFSYAYADYLRKLGWFCPDMIGPNRYAARAVSERVVARFHRRLVKKRKLQQQGRYWSLYWRKLTVEAGPLAYRYLRWFFVRVLKIKSLLGMREEVSQARLDRFR